MMHPDLPLLALSIRQPWAWAIFHGKHIENRGPLALRHMHGRMKPGPNARLVIHASTGMTKDEYESALRVFHRAADAGQLAVPIAEIPKPCDLIRGGLIGTVRYVDTITKSTSPWFFGPRGMIFESAELLPQPIPIVGELGFFDWRADRCQKRVLNRGTLRESEKPAALEAPKPWMIAWPNRAHPLSKAPDGIIRPAATPLLDATCPMDARQLQEQGVMRKAKA